MMQINWDLVLEYLILLQVLEEAGQVILNQQVLVVHPVESLMLAIHHQSQFQ